LLLSRVITALFLLPLAISGILFLPTNYFALIVAVIFIIGAHEWTKIALISPIYNLIFIISFTLLMLLLWTTSIAISSQLHWIIFFAVVFWLVSIYFIINFPRHKTLWSNNLILKFLVGYMVLLPSWYALVLLKDLDKVYFFNTQVTGSELVLIMMVMIWVADTGAYFSGKKWGKTKLIPNVSPGKTRQGAYGAILSNCLISVVFVFSISQDILSSIYMAAFAAIIVMISIVGDLFESMYKRNSNIKDSGKILPGHGGVLDRIDSLTSVAPIFYTLAIVII